MIQRVDSGGKKELFSSYLFLSIFMLLGENTISVEETRGIKITDLHLAREALYRDLRGSRDRSQPPPTS